MENEKQTPQVEKDIVPKPATGIVTLLGAGIYDLEGVFVDPALTKSGVIVQKVYLRSTRVGDVFDASASQVVGNFFVAPSNYVGACRYSLEDADLEEGEMELTIRSKNSETIIARFVGPSEGIGEAFVKHKKGHLHVEPSEHENNVYFKGDGSITSIGFELEDHIVSKKQPFDGITWKAINDNKLKIDVKAGRHKTEPCANFYKNFVNNNKKNMMHSRGGDAAPKELNFAFTGVLTINGKPFNVCIGQGRTSDHNNWHLASPDLSASDDNKKGKLGGEFQISTVDSQYFNIKKV